MSEEHKKTCFVISPIGEAISEIRKRSDQIFEHVIKKAVIPFGYDPIRADKISEPGIITFQIIEQLLKADLVVADLTGRNPNVFYELAIRHAARMPVIQIKEISETIPFDIENMRTIDVDYRFIESMGKCCEEIANQLGRSKRNRPRRYSRR